MRMLRTIRYLQIIVVIRLMLTFGLLGAINTSLKYVLIHLKVGKVQVEFGHVVE